MDERKKLLVKYSVNKQYETPTKKHVHVNGGFFSTPCCAPPSHPLEMERNGRVLGVIWLN